jgi:hypothetical protein
MTLIYEHSSDYRYVQTEATFAHSCSACKRIVMVDALIGIVEMMRDDGPMRHLFCERCNAVLLNEQMHGLHFPMCVYRVYKPFFNDSLPREQE